MDITVHTTANRKREGERGRKKGILHQQPPRRALPAHTADKKYSPAVVPVPGYTTVPSSGVILHNNHHHPASCSLGLSVVFKVTIGGRRMIPDTHVREASLNNSGLKR
jgi:hypothetical protein